MRRKLTVAVALLLVGLALSGSDCILEEKVIELVVLGETCVDFDESHVTDNWTTPETHDIADELDDILADNGIDKNQIISAEVISVTYEVTELPEDAPDWRLWGAITVEYLGDLETFVNYSDERLSDLDGVAKYADLNEDGIDVIHNAIDSYLLDGSPVVTFRVENGDVDPNPSVEVPIVFSWKACLKIYVIVEEDYEWPDIFRD